MRWLKSILRKTPPEETFDREIGFHVEELTRAKIDNGMSPQEAHRQALLEFGGRGQVKQQMWEAHSSVPIERALANLRSAARFIRRSPSFAVAIVLTLALGIGANSAVFSAIDAILLRPLPFPHADELVELHQYDFKNKNPETLVAPIRLEDWNRLNSTFQAISGWYRQDSSVTSGSLPEKVAEAIVAPRFLQVWGVAPALGRNFSADEERFGGPHAVLIGDRYWRSHFHADPGAVGKTLRIGAYSYTIVGVMPRSFHFPDRDVELWTPNPTDAPYAQDRNSTWFTVVGRLKPGVSLVQARADLSTVQTQLGKQYPKTDGSLTVEIQPLKEVVLNGVQGSLWLLYGAVTLLLLIACTNIAALLLARTTQREHEISVRYALGASRSAIVQQLLTEVFVLAFAGSVLGLLVAGGASHVFRMFSKDLPRVEEIALNWRIVAYSLGWALAATFACGLFPAIRSTRRNLAHSIAQGSRTQVSTRMPLQWFLVGVQVSLAVMLLIGAGLLLRSFQALGRVNPGFDPIHVLTLRISGSWGETANMGKLVQRIDRTLDGLRGVPGVEAAATSVTLPGVSTEHQTELTVAEGQRDPNRKIFADERVVSGGYFAVMRIPLLQGQTCRDTSPIPAVVVNRDFANTYFANSPVLGFHLSGAAANTFTGTSEIRGIVGDAREDGLSSPPGPTVYWCGSAPNPDPYYLIRTHGNPMAMADTLRRKIHQLEPTRSVYDVMPLTQHLRDASAENRLRTMLLALFAFTAVSLVSIGLYGTISYLERMREREVALRLALGALPRQILRSFLLQGLRVAAIGGIAGLLLGLGMGQMIAGMLYGISVLDPTTYCGTAMLIFLVALLASLVPAIRAASVDPTQVLREQ